MWFAGKRDTKAASCAHAEYTIRYMPPTVARVAHVCAPLGSSGESYGDVRPRNVQAATQGHTPTRTYQVVLDRVAHLQSDRNKDQIAE